MENTEFKPVKLLLRINLVLYPARVEGLVNIYIYIYIYIYRERERERENSMLSIGIGLLLHIFDPKTILLEHMKTLQLDNYSFLPVLTVLTALRIIASIFWLSGFYGISAFIGYFAPNPFYTNNLFSFKQFSLVWLHSLIVKNMSIPSRSV